MKDNGNQLNVDSLENTNSNIDKKEVYKRPDIKSKKSPRKKLLWTIVLVAIIVVTVWSIVSDEDFSFDVFKEAILSANPWWLLAAVCSMIMYIIFEAFAIKVMIKAFKYKQPLGNCVAYSASDIYFSAITPSATGGQPASAYLMMKDGLPGSFTAVALLIYVVTYNFGIIAMALVTFLIDPSIVLGFSTIGQILIIVGAFCLTCLAIFVLIALYKGNILKRIGYFFVNILAKLRIVKRPEKLKSRIAGIIASYNDCVTHLKGKRNMVIKVFLLSVAQRAATILVTVFVCLAIGGGSVSPFNAWYAQCMVILGTNMLPIPGGSGFFEMLLKDAFASYRLTSSMSASLSLISRGISFYLCIVLCGGALVIKAIVTKVKKKREEAESLRAHQEAALEDVQENNN